MKYSHIIGLFVLFFANNAFSQNQINVLEESNILRMNMIHSELIIKGTSTLHDWDSKAETVTAILIFNDDKNQIEKLNLDVEIASIKNSKGSSIMDKITRKALKESQFPKISYEFINAEVISNNDEELRMKLVGFLTIAGKTNEVEINTVIDKDDMNVVLKGSHTLKMTDFNVDPPTALFGTIKTGDEITIDFLIKF